MIIQEVISHFMTRDHATAIGCTCTKVLLDSQHVRLAKVTAMEMRPWSVETDNGDWDTTVDTDTSQVPHL